ncbi:MAG: YicC family protein [Phycisphaerales bacterium]|nr:MAG: YicC family protein [Phycisphaerales bacterium]
MIVSMTGYGAAEHVEDGVSYALEIRSVNHRYLKTALKLPDAMQFAESAIDKVIRERIARGSVTCTLRTRREADSADCSVNVQVLQGYVDQLSQVRLPGNVQATIDLAALAELPGVCEQEEADDDLRRHQLEIVEDLTGRAVDGLVAMRHEEGKVLYDALMECCNDIREQLDIVTQRAPAVVGEYRDRLQTRVNTLMESSSIELAAEGLMREVALFAERSDISEEITRLCSHLGQFVELCEPGERVGRTLDFIAQELLREANTIASKSNDATIARSVVEIKGQVDRIKEQVQNVE